VYELIGASLVDTVIAANGRVHVMLLTFPFMAEELD
jgi:hypothetical protein